MLKKQRVRDIYLKSQQGELMPADALNKLKYLTDKKKLAVQRFETAVMDMLLNNLILLEAFGSKIRGERNRRE